MENKLKTKTTKAKIFIADIVITIVNSILVFAWVVAEEKGLKQLEKICETVVVSYIGNFNDFAILNLPFVILIYYIYLAFKNGVGKEHKTTIGNIFLAMLNLALLYAVCFMASGMFMMYALSITGGRLG
ncbi:MAG: hypothetical protein LBT96_02085 [Campylobacteraceae bacterium]|jgi:hypothetical protein|nr:hypothetical protein [Campylobacteraceae bacterium]